MISLGFQSRSLDDVPCRSGATACRVSLKQGSNLVFSSGPRGVDVRVLHGSVWLTDDSRDHVLAGDSSHMSPRGRRVLITALGDSEVEVAPVA